MRILDKNDMEVLSPDYGRGYLIEDKFLVAHHDAVEAVEEQGHWKTIAEYPNGGKDVEWVVDVPAVEAKEAWDEYETILRFVEFTAAELAAQRIEELKANLAATDYKILKLVEGALTVDDISADIEQRAAWRAEINELEKKL